MANQATTWVWECSRSEGFDRLVLLSLANRYNLEKRGCWPSFATIARDCGISESTALRSVKNLCELGEVLSQQRKLDSQVNDSNFYSMPIFEKWLTALRLTPLVSDSHKGVVANSHLGGVTETKEPVIETLSKKEKANTLHTTRAALPDWLPKEEWKEFCEMRQRTRTALTEAGKRRVIAKLDALRCRGHDPGKVLGRSIENSWRSVFELPETEKSNLHEQARAIERKYGVG